MIDKNVPGPGGINILKPFGSDAAKFSMVGKGGDNGQKRKARNEPGPGDYKLMSINKEGKYPLSQFRNTSSISFVSKEQRFNYNSKNNIPAPNRYNIKSLIDGKGYMYSSKFRSSPASTITGKGKDLSTKFTNYKSKK